MIDEETLQNVAVKQAEIESRRDTGLARPLNVNESTKG